MHYSVLAVTGLLISIGVPATATAAARARDAQAVGLVSLLEEMTDRDRLAQFPEPGYTCRQFSSYDRDSDTPGSPTWWANDDRSYFLRVEEAAGRKAYVMMDAEGPGAVVRFWATWHGASGKPFSNGILRFYLDGADTPAIEGPIQGVLDGGLLAGAPLSEGVSPQTEYGQRGHNLYLPIPYAKHCKITYETDAPIDEGARRGEALYYQINYRTYDKGTAVESFSMERLKAAGETLDKTQKALAGEQLPNYASLTELSNAASLAAGDSLSLDAQGPGAVVSLSLRLSADDLAQALRSTIVEMTFDEQRTVWCPAGDFFGTGYLLNPYASRYTSVSADGTLSCFWTMPFKGSAAVTVRNLGEQTVRIDTLRMKTRPWTWNRRSLYFHAAWKQWTKLATCSNTQAQDHGAFDLNWVTVTGRGVYVGDTLTLFNGAASWWGEGDEKIYVDGETFPSHFGTGTEDYYGYAWCRPEFFQSAFHAQPNGGGNLAGGFSVNSRYRALDAIPFRTSLRFDMEMWHWARTKINYAPTTFWYAGADAASTVPPMPEEARQKVAMAIEDVVEIKRVAGALEGESLTVREKTGGKTEIQSVAHFEWSGNKQLWWIDGKVGDRLELEFSVATAGAYAVTAAMTKAKDYGIVTIALNGETAAELDLYIASENTEVIDLGVHRLKEGVNQLRITIAGANPEAIKRYMVGLDYLRLTRQPD